METTTSRDGTTIAYDRLGDGPPVIMVAGAFGNRGFPSVLPGLLAEHFTVINYDRRGRNDSGDTAPYAVEREVEDLEALIADAGGSASVYGMSSGALLCLEAARTLPVASLALYEPPMIVDDTRPPLPRDYVQRLDELTAAGRRGDAVEYFLLTAVGVPADFIEQMKTQPVWAALEAVAHTLAYDGRVMGDTMSGSPEPLVRWADVPVPVLVIDGGASEQWQHNSAQALVDVLPNAQRKTLAGQTHDVSMDVLAPVLIDFFAGVYARA